MGQSKMAFSIPEAPCKSFVKCIGLNANAHITSRRKTLTLSIYD